MMQSFWQSKGVPVSISVIKGLHQRERNNDKNSRSTVASDSEGMTVSNLFSLDIDEKVTVHRYVLEVAGVEKRRIRIPTHKALRLFNNRTLHNIRVSPSSSSTSLVGGSNTNSNDNKVSIGFPTAVVSVADHVYSRHAIPDELLSVRRDMLDSGWAHCRLIKDGEHVLKRMAPDALQPLVNGILPWSVGNQQQQLQQQRSVFNARHENSRNRNNNSNLFDDDEDGGGMIRGNFNNPTNTTTPQYNSVRTRDGKIVCTTDSITVEGIRVFEGTSAHALYVNGPFVDGPSGSLVPTSRDLATVVKEGPITRPITFVVKVVEGAVTVRNRHVLTVIVGDSGGEDKILRIWDSPHLVISVGKTYVALGLQAVRNLSVAGGLLELAATASSTIQLASVAAQMAAANPNLIGLSPTASHDLLFSSSVPDSNPLDPRLMLRLDTKCTVASESSLWEEVRQHFGPPPYSKDVQRQINQAAEGMPVISSSTLRHGVVKILNFSADSLKVVPLSDDVRAAFPLLDQHQPLAILDDYSIVPLQMLHCCFDPHMKAWQDIAVAACSFFPRRRVEVLNRFRQHLTGGLGVWGISSSPYAATTSDVSVLGAPKAKAHYASGGGAQKTAASNNNYSNQQKQQYQPRAAPPPPQPSHRIFIGVPTANATDAQREMCWGTATHVGQQFSVHNSSNLHVITAEKEVEAMGKLDELVSSFNNNNNKSGVVGRAGGSPYFQPVVTIFSNDRESRASRWMLAECLRKGCIPIMMPAVKANKVKLLAANLKMQISNKMRTDPLADGRVDLSSTIPSLMRKNVLLVGIDTCHVSSVTVGAMTGMLLLNGVQHQVQQQQQRANIASSSILSTFWRVDVRGQELEQVTENFKSIIDQAVKAVGTLDEVVVMQDGSVFSELYAMKRCVPDNCGLTFTCLHKRTHIRFHHEGAAGAKYNNDGGGNNSYSNSRGGGTNDGGSNRLIANNVRGTIIQALTPSSARSSNVAPSFFIQSHDSAMSTARPLQVSIHCSSATLPNADLQQLLFALSHLASFVPTKLPLPTRCAHLLSAKIERLIDADPSFDISQMKENLKFRMWFL